MVNTFFRPRKKKESSDEEDEEEADDDDNDVDDKEEAEKENASNQRNANQRKRTADVSPKAGEKKQVRKNRHRVVARSVSPEHFKKLPLPNGVRSHGP
jgi:hypothetical protein